MNARLANKWATSGQQKEDEKSLKRKAEKKKVGEAGRLAPEKERKEAGGFFLVSQQLGEKGRVELSFRGGF